MRQRFCAVALLACSCSSAPSGREMGADSGVKDSGRGSCEWAPETCNGQDDDCDGVVDEGIHITGDWSFVAEPTPTLDITDVAVTAAGGLLVATDENGLHVRAAPDGQWSNPIVDRQVSALVTDPRVPDLVLAASARFDGGVSGAIWRSINGGISFSVVEERDQVLSSLLVGRTDPRFLVIGVRQGELEGVLVSSDQGDSFVPHDFGFGRDQVIPWAVVQLPSGTLITSTELGDHPEPYPAESYPPVLRSRDAGETWTNVRHPAMWHAVSMVVEAETGRLYYQEEGAALWSTDDEGDTWIKEANTGLMTLILDPASGCLIGRGRRDAPGVFVSCNRGVTFTRVADLPGVVAVVDAQGGRLYLGAFQGGVWSSAIPRCE